MARRRTFVSRLRPREEARRSEAYQSMGSDGDAARSIGLPIQAFAEWRRRRALPAKHPAPGNTVLSKAEQKRRLAAYHISDTDSDAARKLNMPRTTFHGWREIQQLPAKTSRPAEIDGSEEARRHNAYHATNSDEDAATFLHIGIGGFKWWRQQRGLPGKGTGGPSVADQENARRREAYEVTANDIEAAARLGMTQSGFQRWRAKAGLPAKTPNKGLHVTPREQARRMRTYPGGHSDEESARRLGLKLATYRGWRQAQGLPAHRRPVSESLAASS